MTETHSLSLMKTDTQIIIIILIINNKIEIWKRI